MKKIVVLKNFNKELGQSLLEVVFSIGVIALVVTGSVALIINAVGLKNNSLQRKKAAEMAETIIEDLIKKEKSEMEVFWEKNGETEAVLNNFEGFDYLIEYSDVDVSGCDSSSCTNVTVTINWGNPDNLKNLEVSRFFSRSVD
jgi:Tfp pilus assembly protein PilV